MKVKVISLPYIFQVLYVLCFTRPRYQVSVYRTIGPLVMKICQKIFQLLSNTHPFSSFVFMARFDSGPIWVHARANIDPREWANMGFDLQAILARVTISKSFLFLVKGDNVKYMYTICLLFCFIYFVPCY